MPPSKRFQIAHGYKRHSNTWLKMCAIGLSLCLLLWGLSYVPRKRTNSAGTFRYYGFQWNTRNDTTRSTSMLRLSEGMVVYCYTPYSTLPPDFTDRSFSCFVCCITWYNCTQPNPCYYVDIYFWRISLLFAIPLIYGLARRGYRHYSDLRRRANFLCIKCGYPLRGLRTPVCPECGTVFDPRLLQPLQSQCQPQKPDPPGP